MTSSHKRKKSKTTITINSSTQQHIQTSDNHGTVTNTYTTENKTSTTVTEKSKTTDKTSSGGNTKSGNSNGNSAQAQNCSSPNGSVQIRSPRLDGSFGDPRQVHWGCPGGMMGGCDHPEHRN